MKTEKKLLIFIKCQHTCDINISLLMEWLEIHLIITFLFKAILLIKKISPNHNINSITMFFHLRKIKLNATRTYWNFFHTHLVPSCLSSWLVSSILAFWQIIAQLWFCLFFSFKVPFRPINSLQIFDYIWDYIQETLLLPLWNWWRLQQD